MKATTVQVDATIGYELTDMQQVQSGRRQKKVQPLEQRVDSTPGEVARKAIKVVQVVNKGAWEREIEKINVAIESTIEQQAYDELYGALYMELAVAFLLLRNHEATKNGKLPPDQRYGYVRGMLCSFRRGRNEWQIMQQVLMAIEIVLYEDMVQEIQAKIHARKNANRDRRDGNDDYDGYGGGNTDQASRDSQDKHGGRDNFGSKGQGRGYTSQRQQGRGGMGYTGSYRSYKDALMYECEQSDSESFVSREARFRYDCANAAVELKHLLQEIIDWAESFQATQDDKIDAWVMEQGVQASQEAFIQHRTERQLQLIEKILQGALVHYHEIRELCLTEEEVNALLAKYPELDSLWSKETTDLVAQVVTCNQSAYSGLAKEAALLVLLRCVASGICVCPDATEAMVAASDHFLLTPTQGELHRLSRLWNNICGQLAADLVDNTLCMQGINTDDPQEVSSAFAVVPQRVYGAMAILQHGARTVPGVKKLVERWKDVCVELSGYTTPVADAEPDAYIFVNQFREDFLETIKGWDISVTPAKDGTDSVNESSDDSAANVALSDHTDSSTAAPTDAFKPSKTPGPDARSSTDFLQSDEYMYALKRAGRGVDDKDHFTRGSRVLIHLPGALLPTTTPKGAITVVSRVEIHDTREEEAVVQQGNYEEIIYGAVKIVEKKNGGLAFMATVPTLFQSVYANNHFQVVGMNDKGAFELWRGAHGERYVVKITLHVYKQALMIPQDSTADYHKRCERRALHKERIATSAPINDLDTDTATAKITVDLPCSHAEPAATVMTMGHGGGHSGRRTAAVNFATRKSGYTKLMHTCKCAQAHRAISSCYKARYDACKDSRIIRTRVLIGTRKHVAHRRRAAAHARTLGSRPKITLRQLLQHGGRRYTRVHVPFCLKPRVCKLKKKLVQRVAHDRPLPFYLDLLQQASKDFNRSFLRIERGALVCVYADKCMQLPISAPYLCTLAKLLPAEMFISSDIPGHDVDTRPDILDEDDVLFQHVCEITHATADTTASLLRASSAATSYNMPAQDSDNGQTSDGTGNSGHDSNLKSAASTPARHAAASSDDNGDQSSSPGSPSSGGPPSDPSDSDSDSSESDSDLTSTSASSHDDSTSSSDSSSDSDSDCEPDLAPGLHAAARNIYTSIGPHPPALYVRDRHVSFDAALATGDTLCRAWNKLHAMAHCHQVRTGHSATTLRCTPYPPASREPVNPSYGLSASGGSTAGVHINLQRENDVRNASATSGIAGNDLPADTTNLQQETTASGGSRVPTRDAHNTSSALGNTGSMASGGSHTLASDTAGQISPAEVNNEQQETTASGGSRVPTRDAHNTSEALGNTGSMASGGSHTPLYDARGIYVSSEKSHIKDDERLEYKTAEGATQTDSGMRIREELSQEFGRDVKRPRRENLTKDDLRELQLAHLIRQAHQKQRKTLVECFDEPKVTMPHRQRELSGYQAYRRVYEGSNC